MNKEKEIQRIEEEMRKLADDLAELKQHKPNTGEVWTYDNSPCNSHWLQICGMAISLRSFAPCPGIVDPAHYTYLGKFDDVYITKKKVAEIVNEARDASGDNLWGDNGLYSSGVRRLRAALINAGITQSLVEDA